jgi:hypothetical protein
VASCHQTFKKKFICIGSRRGQDNKRLIISEDKRRRGQAIQYKD